MLPAPGSLQGRLHIKPASVVQVELDNARGDAYRFEGFFHILSSRPPPALAPAFGDRDLLARKWGGGGARQVGQPLANRGFIDPGRRGLGHPWRRPRDTLSRSRSCARAVAGLFFPGPFLPGAAAACKKCPEEECGDEHSAGYIEYFAPYWHSLIRLHSLFDLTACRRIVYLSPLCTPSLLLRLAPPGKLSLCAMSSGVGGDDPPLTIHWR